MKISETTMGVILISIMTFFSSCSEDEEIFYYSFKNIEYSLSSDDGIAEYDTPWEECYILINNSEKSEVKSGPSDIYVGYHEYYCFECADGSTFNPTPGYVHVPLPEDLTSANQIVFEEKEGEYSLDKIEVNRSYDRKMFNIPAKTKFILERKVTMKRLVLTYKATFQRHPSGKDHVVTGKFFRYVPIGIALLENHEVVD